MRPSVSIIVPVYNTERYLRKCLDSLMYQTLESIEVIAVNDGSTDRSRDILEEYQKKFPEKIRIIHKENGGQASARNQALAVCNGEYVGFLDSDDFVCEEMFEKMYCRAKDEDADYVACGYTDITYENGKEIVLQEYVASKPAYCTKDMFFGALVSPFLHIYRRELLEKSKVIFPEGFIYEDTAFYLNLVPYIRRIETIEEALAFRLRHSNSTTTTFKKERVKEIIPIIQNSVEYYIQNGFYEMYEKELEYFCVRVLLCSSMQRISKVAALRDSFELANETMAYIKKTFPNYKKNEYFAKGAINRYMKSVNKLTLKVYLVVFRLRNRIGREYS